MKVLFLKSFAKRLGKVPQKIRDKFRARLIIFLENSNHPLLNNHSVHKVFAGCRSINITGDYRAIFKIQSGTFVFVTVGTHSELYK